jgi:formamidopyrimidine-DNA glycosylase
MIELPEAVTLARQINATLCGKTLAGGLRGNAPHKFAFYNREPEEYAAILPGRTVGQAAAYGSTIRIPIEPGYVMVLGEGGEHIVYHPDASSVPAKHQLLLRFADDSYLSVRVSGWGACFLFTPDELAAHPFAGRAKVSPLSDAFTRDYFETLFAGLPPDAKASVKYFVISEPGVWGVGNGYLQDILFRAKLHPRHRAAQLSRGERDALYAAIRGVLCQAVGQGGRDTEHDLFDRPGGYLKLLDNRAAGQPCPICAATIVKEQFLGGAVYYCPACQV